MKRKRYKKRHIHKSMFIAMRSRMRFEIGWKLENYKPTNDDWIFEYFIAHGYKVTKKG